MKYLINALPVFVALSITGCASVGTSTNHPPQPQAVVGLETSEKAESTDLVISKAAVGPGSGADGKSILACQQGGTYHPVEPIEIFTYQKLSHSTGTMENLAWPTEAEEIHKLLPNIASNVRAYHLNTTSTIGPFGGGYHDKRIIMDFMKYRAEPLFDRTSGAFLNYGRVGVGMRLKIDIRTKEANLNLGSLVALAISADAGETSGRITTDIIGLDAPNITLSAPLSADLTAKSIEQVLQSFSAIRSNFSDDDVSLSPQLVAVINCS